jgi:hypothetical protein
MKPPVFIVGCPRSGTSFLYHLLLSAGGFAEFHTQMNVYDVLEPIYGDLGVFKNRRAAIREWLRSKAFRVSSLDAEAIKTKILNECRGASDFLRIIMDEIAIQQGVDRWIDSTPTNIPHMERIHRDFPQARFIHIIRDPRDVALSLDKRGWSRPLPGDRSNSLVAAGLYWEWIVRKGRKAGQALAPFYLEIRYEDLVQRPAETLETIGTFLDHDLNYERIQKTGIGSVTKPLTSFKEDLQLGSFNPIGRWNDKFPSAKLALFEAMIGDYMKELGYQPASFHQEANRSLAARSRRFVYRSYYEGKQWAKIHTPLSRLMVDYSAILIDK